MQSRMRPADAPPDQHYRRGNFHANAYVTATRSYETGSWIDIGSVLIRQVLVGFATPEPA